MATLGRAFITVHADTSPFAREVRRSMRQLDQDLQEDTDRAGERLGQRLSENISRNVEENTSINVRTDLSSASVAATEAGLRRVTRDRQVNVRINRRGLTSSVTGAFREVLQAVGQFAGAFIQIFGDLFSFGRVFGRIFQNAFQQFNTGAGSAQRAGSQLLGAIAQLVAAFAAMGTILVLVNGLIGFLAGAISAAAQAAMFLLTLLPGFAAVGLAALGPLVLVFSNLGEVIGATGGELEEFQELLDNFGPRTQTALQGLRDLIQFFISIREDVQEAFFDPISQAIEDLDADLRDVFSQGLERVAGGAGRFVAGFIELFEHPQAAQFFENIFRLAELGFDEIGEAGLNLLGAFTNLADATLPRIEDSVESIAATINDWADSINDFADSPNLDETLNRWEDAFRSIRDLTGSIAGAVGEFINQFGDEGIDILDRVTGFFSRMQEFFESEQGREFFDGLYLSALLFLGVVIQIWNFFVGINVALSRVSRLLLDNQEIILAIGAILFPLIGVVAEIARNWDTIRALLRRINGWVLSHRGILQNILAVLSPIYAIYLVIEFLVRQIYRWVTSTGGSLRSALGALRGIRNVAIVVRNAIQNVAFQASNVAGAIGRALSNAWGLVNALRSVASFSLGSLRLPGFGQEGGIFARPTNLIIGEAGAEALIPLTRPNRAMELLEASGLADMVRGGDGAAAPTSVNRTVLEFRGSGGLLDLIRREVRIRGGNVQMVLGGR